VSETFFTGVDFVYVPTQSFDTAVAFYGDVLGLPCSARYGRTPGAEFETGTLTLAVIDPRPTAARGTVTLPLGGKGARAASLLIRSWMR
jgi:catechol 2,3-dioxygenase-like lactoylglutathione lyase family enzyme